MTINAPVIRYHGSKFRLAPWVLQHFPEHAGRERRRPAGRLHLASFSRFFYVRLPFVVGF